jgi:hypothetical protein
VLRRRASRTLFGVTLPFWVAFAFPVGAGIVAVVSRRVRGLPVLFFTVKNADFLQEDASGNAPDTAFGTWTRYRNCVVVAIANRRLVIRPRFPLNLFGELEFDVPLDAIESLEIDRPFLRDRVRLALRDGSGRRREVWLFLSDPEKFIRSAQRVPTAHSANTR